MPQKLPTAARHRKSAKRLFLREKSIRSKNPSFASVMAAVNQDDRKMKEYTRQLREKQKVRRLYGIPEGQFKRYYQTASAAENTSSRLLELLEMRLDNVVYRSGFTNSRAQSRQMVGHRLFNVNGRRVDIPSYQVKLGDVITPQKPDLFQDREFDLIPGWLLVDKKKLAAKVANPLTREDIDQDINEQLIVEYYSR